MISILHSDCRVIESFVKEDSDKLSASCLDYVIELCVNEMVKASEHTPLIQDPCLEILVAVGRFHCTKVMEGLLQQLVPNQVGHFMVLHCVGSLAIANTNGTIQFIKPLLETILSSLSSIRFDYIKQAYSFGKHFNYFLSFPKTKTSFDNNKSPSKIKIQFFHSIYSTWTYR